MLVCKTTVATTIFCFVATTIAFSSDMRSRSAARPQTPQFQSWYPKHNKALINFTLTTCNASYVDYLTAFNSPLHSRNASYLLGTCHRLEACLLDAVPPNWQANFNSTVVVLGLMPTLLATIGPSVAEISLLSAHRPFLSFLISLGAPAIWPTRVFEYIHPTELLRGRRGALCISKIRPWRAAMMSLGQYMIAIGAILNVTTTSIGMGRKSILAFGCTTTFAPLLWSILPFVIHLVSVVSYLIARKMARRRIPVKRVLEQGDSPETVGKSEQLKSERSQAITSSMPQHRSHGSWLSWLRDAWSSETTICANHSKSRHIHDKTRVPKFAVLLAVTAGLMSFGHVALGTIIFSSQQFITVWDVVNQILWRYLLSSTACRLLLIAEISGLRSSDEASGSVPNSPA